MTPEKICDKLADIGEDACQLRSGDCEPLVGFNSRLANIQDAISTLRQDVARPLMPAV